MSFSTKLVNISEKRYIEIQNEKEEKQRKFLIEREKRLDEIMYGAIKKYFNTIKIELYSRANSGKRTAWLSFEKIYFKADFPTLGYPKDLCYKWLKFMTDDIADSKYLPTVIGSNTNIWDKDSISGIKFKICYTSIEGEILVKFYW